MVTVRHWQPAAFDVAGMHRIAVVDFRGDHGPEVAAALKDRISNNRFYALVDQSDMAPPVHAACALTASDDQWLCCARERGVDGVIIGEVREYRCDDRVVAGGDASGGPEDEAPAEHDRARWQAGLRRPEQIHRDAVVTVAFRLVDAQTGEVRAAREASHRFHGEESAAADLPSRSEVLAGLTRQCLDEFVEMLAPHQVSGELPLACTRWFCRTRQEVRTGNRHALSGDWDAARDAWQAALDQNADCDAALYNLALDAARRHLYGEAEDLAMRAIRVRHTDRYAQGLEQIRQFRTSYEAVEQQRNERVLHASVPRSR